MKSTTVVNAERCMCSREFLLQLRDVAGAEHHCCQRRALYVFTCVFLQLRDVAGAEHHCCQRRALYVFT